MRMSDHLLMAQTGQPHPLKMDGLILFLQIIGLVKTQQYLSSAVKPVFVKEGDNLTITCFYQSNDDKSFSWFKHKTGQKPELVSTLYKYENEPIFYNEFGKSGRFSMVNGKGVAHLGIKELQLSDSATYYCGTTHFNILEFLEGTELIIKAPQSHSVSVLQQPVLELLHPGENVTLQCTVVVQSCAGEHSVYWLKHESGKSHPGIIYTDRDSNDQCKNSSKAGSPTQSCIYSLPISNISTLDAGNYYCAVSACGEILFGNEIKLDIKGKCTELLWKLIILALAILNIIFLCVIVILGGQLRIYRQKWAIQTADLNQNEDTTVVNYAGLSFTDTRSTSRRPAKKENHEPSLYAQVKINQQ